MFRIGNKSGDSDSDAALVQSLLRGLDILRRLGAADHGMTLGELVADLGLKQPTVYKLVRTLVAAGFVERSDRPVRYSLGSGAFELADEYWKQTLLRRAAMVVRRLFGELREYAPTLTVAQALGGEVEAVLRMSPDQPGILQHPRGMLMAPYASASGLTFQAFWSEVERREYQRRHSFEEEGAHRWGTTQRLEELLREIRAKGYATPPYENRKRHAVAVPVYAGSHELVAVLGVSLAERVLPEEEWQEQVKRVVEAAAELSATE
ncbi:IclR family transcriptional regulator [bacterium]|nr:IclR family transcriptional regulator [bacterium]